VAIKEAGGSTVAIKEAVSAQGQSRKQGAVSAQGQSRKQG